MKRSAIEAAFHRLPLLPGKEIFLGSAINILCDVDCAGQGTAPPKFSIVSRKRTKKELEKLANPKSDLRACLDELHQPAILALAAHGYCRERGPLPEKLREIAKRAAQSDLKWAPESFAGGKPKNNRAHAVATLLAYYYELLTGKKPSRSVNPYKDNDAAYGPFIDLVRSVFKALGLRVNAEDVARAAIKKRKALKKKHKTPRRVSSIIKT